MNEKIWMPTVDTAQVLADHIKICAEQKADIERMRKQLLSIKELAEAMQNENSLLVQSNSLAIRLHVEIGLFGKNK